MMLLVCRPIYNGVVGHTLVRRHHMQRQAPRQLTCFSASTTQAKTIPTMLLYHRCFLSTKQPPLENKQQQQQGRKSSSTRSGNQTSENLNTTTASPTTTTSSNKNQQQQQQQDILTTPVQRFKHSKRKVWKQTRQQRQQQQKQAKHHYPGNCIVQFSQYTCERTTTVTQLSSSSTKTPPSPSSPPILKSIDASAFLNQREFCKTSGKFTQTNNVSWSISGTDAARRLLRGKKGFLNEVRKLMSNPNSPSSSSSSSSPPILLEGHSVPPELLQHCVNMADALLRHYGPDVVECSFHNYYPYRRHNHQRDGDDDNNSNKVASLPLHIRVRQRDATNTCLPPPTSSSPSFSDEKKGWNQFHAKNNHAVERNDNEIDWDYHLKLYLTIMERMAGHLGKIFEIPSRNNNDNRNNNEETTNTAQRSMIKEYELFASDDDNTSDDDDDDESNDNDDNDITSSPLLFPPPRPRWNVDILRGAYFDLQPVQKMDALVPQRKRKQPQQEGNGDDYVIVPPMPIVEFVQGNSKSSGHILIRLQGHAKPSPWFDGTSSSSSRRRSQPVTLVFDAGYYRNPSNPSTVKVFSP